MSDIISALASDPMLTGYAQDYAQRKVKLVAQFLAPTVEVPELEFQYKIYDSKTRYRRVNTKRPVGGRATRIGFTADDEERTLKPRALDFPMDKLEGKNAKKMMNLARYGVRLVADAASLDHEADVLEKAQLRATANTPINQNFTSESVDPVDVIEEQLLEMKKVARNGADVKILWGTTAFRRFKNNKNVRAQFNGTKGGHKVPTLEDVRKMFMLEPEMMISDIVLDSAPEGKDPNIDFIMTNQIWIFASNSDANTMDPSFMKTFRLEGEWMKPGEYESEDRRDKVLKLDWVGEPEVTNTAAIKQINANAA